MKKNMFLRVASVLLVLTLLSTCAISGTFAKYVTSADDSDTARVAKWGVEVKTWNTDKTGGAKVSLFSKEYNETGSVTVQASDKNLVAPGTKNETGVQFSITGTPEVAVDVQVDLVVINDVFVKAQDATYLDWTTGNSTTDKFTLASDYTPVEYTLTQNGTAVVTNGTLADVQAYFDGLCNNKTYAPGTNLATTFGTYILTWAWDFDASGAGTNDKVDSLIGQVAAGIDTTDYGKTGEDANVNTDIEFTLDLTVTQVD